jgi:hypothetical protein
MYPFANELPDIHWLYRKVFLISRPFYYAEPISTVSQKSIEISER